jgi:hypothetical protein
MTITLGKATGLVCVRTDIRRGFVLMLLGWTISYVHFLEDHIGIAWSRTLEIGECRYWLTEDWKVWAKKDKSGLKFLLRSARSD